jgi:hypothetical protein
MPYNFEVNLITRLGDIALFSSFLAHLTQGSGELLSPLSVRRPSVRPLTFHILINSSKTTGPI